MRAISLNVFACLSFSIAIAGFARPVAPPSLEELWKDALVVAVIRPLWTTNASDQLTWAGPKYGARDPLDYQAMNTRFQVVTVFKAPDDLKADLDKGLTLLHFRYASGVEFNGGNFMYFDFPPTKLNLVVEGDPGAKAPIAHDSPTYLAFLTRHKDGRFVPITGHYDSEFSFRILATPQSGKVRYASAGLMRAKGTGNPPVQRTEPSLSGELTDKPPISGSSLR